LSVGRSSADIPITRAPPRRIADWLRKSPRLERAALGERLGVEIEHHRPVLELLGEVEAERLAIERAHGAEIGRGSPDRKHGAAGDRHRAAIIANKLAHRPSPSWAMLCLCPAPRQPRNRSAPGVGAGEGKIMLEHLPRWLGHALTPVRAGSGRLAVAALRPGECAVIELGSTAFGDGERIPERFTADGAGVSPPLHWDALPDGTAALALLVEDADSPTLIRWSMRWCGISTSTPTGSRRARSGTAATASPAARSRDRAQQLFAAPLAAARPAAGAWRASLRVPAVRFVVGSRPRARAGAQRAARRAWRALAGGGDIDRHLFARRAGRGRPGVEPAAA
jgi:hypothetical protein